MSAEDFEFDFTEEMVIEMLRGNEEAEDWYDAMCEILPLWEMNTPERVAMFIAQCGHESNNFKVLSENLNYSAKALDALFGKYFKRAGRDAQEYHRQPRKIANVIYASVRKQWTNTSTRTYHIIKDRKCQQKILNLNLPKQQ